MDGQSIPPRTPEEIRAERIAAIVDPRVRQDLDAIAKARDAKIAQERERQEQNFEKRVAELRDQKIRSANAPRLTPSGMRPPYLGKDGHERATIDAKAQIQTLNDSHLKNVAKQYNDQIDKRLDVQRENQAAPSTVIPMKRSVPEPNRYAKLIEQQNYAERANQAKADRPKEMDQAQQQQRQRGLQR